jgi:hypothetical protein
MEVVFLAGALESFMGQLSRQPVLPERFTGPGKGGCWDTCRVEISRPGGCMEADFPDAVLGRKKNPSPSWKRARRPWEALRSTPRGVHLIFNRKLSKEGGKPPLAR